MIHKKNLLIQKGKDQNKAKWTREEEEEEQ